MIARRATALATVLAAGVSLAACGGGGGGGGSTSVPAPHTVAPATAAPSGPTAQVTFRIDGGTTSASSTARTPKYVSPATQSATVSLQGQRAPLGTVNLTPGSPNCTTGTNGLQCTVTVAAPIGSDTFVIATYDGQNGTGNLLSTGTVTQTVALNATNTVALVLDGVVSTVAVILGSSSVQAGTPAAVAVTVVAKDAQNNIIIGPGNYSSPVTLTNSDTSGVTTLSTTNVAGPATSVTLNYTGASSLGATITPSAGGTPGTAATFTPTGAVFTNYTLAGTGISVLAPGYDGNVWFASNDGMGFITPGGVATIYAPNSAAVFSMAPATNGAEWFGDVDGDIGSLTASGTFGLLSTPLSTPYGCGTSHNTYSISRRRAEGQASTVTCGPVNWMLLGPDNNLWFADDNGLIGTVTTAGTGTEWDYTQLPGWQGGGSEPDQIVFGPGPDAEDIYVSDELGLIERVAINGGVPTRVDQLANTTCSEFPGTDTVAIGLDGNVWTSDDCANLIAVPSSNFATAQEQAWSIGGLTGGYGLGGLMTIPGGGVWGTTFETNIVYRITNAGTAAAPVPAISSLTTFPASESLNFIIPGPDGNVWASAFNGSTEMLAKITYGVPATGSLSLIRALPHATNHVSRNPAALHRRTQLAR